MSLKPSKLKKGDKLHVSYCGGAGSYTATFVGRTPAQGKGRPAVNTLCSNEWRDADNKEGLAVISDYDLSRKGRYA